MGLKVVLLFSEIIKINFPGYGVDECKIVALTHMSKEEQVTENFMYVGVAGVFRKVPLQEFKSEHFHKAHVGDGVQSYSR